MIYLWRVGKLLGGMSVEDSNFLDRRVASYYIVHMFISVSVMREAGRVARGVVKKKSYAGIDSQVQGIIFLFECPTPEEQ